MSNGFDSLLRKSLRGQRSRTDRPESGAGVCLDAGTIAAWFAGTLPAADLAQAQAHASQCGRCQELIAALARIEEPRPAAAWWRGHAVRWMMPAVAAAAAAIAWFNVPSGPARTPVPALPAQTRADVPAPPRATVGAATSAPAAGVGGLPPAAVPPSQANAAARRTVGPPGFADEARRRSAAPPVSERLTDTALAGEQIASTAAAPAAAPAPAPLPQAASGVAAQDSATPEVTSQVQPRALESIAMLVAAAPRAPAAAVIASPGQRTLWRIAGTQVFRSADAGVTWQQRHSGASAQLTAGASPSDDVCWIAGRRGVVLQTKDGGQSWTAITVPGSEDLVAVTADDDKSAAVITAGGRTLRTTDGGVSWR